MNIERAESQLVLHEGIRLRPYPDTDDPPNWTLGVGYNVTSRGLEAFDDAIGRVIAWEIGSPVTADLVTHDECFTMLRADIVRVDAAVRTHCPFYDSLNDPRQRVCLDMAFNMGLRALGFKRTIAAVEHQDWSTAARELHKSTWLRQVGPSRVDRLAKMLLTGQDYTS